jgi:predicted unusual protein kinase regulating ubiquinone biosynthesis (AarF/ABC1/UbiB family)
MVAEVDPGTRERMLLLLLAFSQEDAPFLSQVVLSMAGDEQTLDDEDRESFEKGLAALIARYRTLSLREIQLGPMLQEVTEISVRHNVRLPASLALAGKAFAQMQLAAGELDPTLDPLSVAGTFVMKKTLRELTTGLDPRKLFYEGQKARARLANMIEALEGVTGARPGGRLQVNFRGTERLESSIALAGRRLSLALALGGAIVGGAMTANSPRVGRWVPAAMGGLGSVMAIGLVTDLLRRDA